MNVFAYSNVQKLLLYYDIGYLKSVLAFANTLLSYLDFSYSIHLYSNTICTGSTPSSIPVVLCLLLLPRHDPPITFDRCHTFYYPAV